jgi:PAS domain S-box-containing protein
VTPRRAASRNPIDILTLGAEPFLAALVRTSNDAIIGKSLDGTVVFWNESAERLYGYSAAEMLGRDISVLFPSDLQGELADLLARTRSGENIRDYQTVRVRKNGSMVAVSIAMSPVVDADGATLGISVIAHDLTRHNMQIADLREAHRRADETLSTLETLHGSAPVGLGFFDRDGRIIHINEFLAAIDGSTVEEEIGRTVAEAVPDIWAQIEPVFHSVLEDDEAVLNIEVSGEVAHDPGRLHHWLSSYYPVHLDKEVIGVGVVVIDVTERRRAESFRSSVMNNMAEGLITVDAEGNMTSINHAACEMLGWGEEELLGQVMSQVILPRGDDGSIREDMSQLLRVRGEGVHVRLNEAEYLCKNGSLLPVALTASPLLSGTVVEGAVVVFRDVTEERSERIRVARELAALSWVGRIREALDEGRLVLYSQPIVPLRGGIPSAELLLRMIGRDGEVIGPDAFLGVAERYGLIAEIDQWVVKQAVHLAASGRHVGVNLSAESIVTIDMLSLIENEIKGAGADPSNLVFEITETALMRDIEKGQSFTNGVVDLGCSVALDDFGTGYGTFTHVKKLKVKYLKIDIEFVRGLVGSPENQAVVKAIVNLAQGFGCETVAEGVEDGDVLTMLRELNVDYAQGFHLGRPAAL